MQGKEIKNKNYVKDRCKYNKRNWLGQQNEKVGRNGTSENIGCSHNIWVRIQVEQVHFHVTLKKKKAKHQMKIFL